jgi:uncharacterized protein YndB with AHSA1/START domain
MLQAEPTCLVIADISGYTSYLAGVELDHAQDILADLTDVVVRSLRPTFRLAKLEGDAAFAYVVADSIDGSALQDAVERCYVAFRRRLRDIGQASQCDCYACTRMPTLDLKFVVHHGRVARQRMAGREELVGSDVIVVHRLLKNTVHEALGLGAYAFYTDACVRAMGIEDPRAAGLLEQHETYDVVGEVIGWVRDLDSVWHDADSRASIQVTADQAAWSTSYELPAPPAVAWEWLTSPIRRPQWQADVTAVTEATAGGRRGVGTTNHCIHGRDAIVEEILAWQPPELFTVRDQLPVPDMPKFVLSELLEPIDDGSATRVTVRVARPASAKDRGKLEQIRPLLVHSFEGSIPPLRAALAAEMAARAAADATAPPEPEVPVLARRFLARPG